MWLLGCLVTSVRGCYLNKRRIGLGRRPNTADREEPIATMVYRLISGRGRRAGGRRVLWAVACWSVISMDPWLSLTPADRRPIDLNAWFMRHDSLQHESLYDDDCWVLPCSARWIMLIVSFFIINGRQLPLLADRIPDRAPECRLFES